VRFTDLEVERKISAEEILRNLSTLALPALHQYIRHSHDRFGKDQTRSKERHCCSVAASHDAQKFKCKSPRGNEAMSESSLALQLNVSLNGRIAIMPEGHGVQHLRLLEEPTASITRTGLRSPTETLRFPRNLVSRVTPSTPHSTVLKGLTGRADQPTTRSQSIHFLSCCGKWYIRNYCQPEQLLLLFHQLVSSFHLAYYP
jgi:hypothetical protein